MGANCRAMTAGLVALAGAHPGSFRVAYHDLQVSLVADRVE